MANKRKSRSGAVMGIAVLIVLLLVLNVAASRMSATIAMGIGRFTSDALNEDTDYTVESNYLDGFEASVDIMSEGTVLIKNDVIDGGEDSDSLRSQLEVPYNLTYDFEAGTFSFTAVENAAYYRVYFYNVTEPSEDLGNTGYFQSETKEVEQENPDGTTSTVTETEYLTDENGDYLLQPLETILSLTPTYSKRFNAQYTDENGDRQTYEAGDTVTFELPNSNIGGGEYIVGIRAGGPIALYTMSDYLVDEEPTTLILHNVDPEISTGTAMDGFSTTFSQYGTTETTGGMGGTSNSIDTSNVVLENDGMMFEIDNADTYCSANPDTQLIYYITETEDGTESDAVTFSYENIKMTRNDSNTFCGWIEAEQGTDVTEGTASVNNYIYSHSGPTMEYQTTGWFWISGLTEGQTYYLHIYVPGDDGATSYDSEYVTVDFVYSVFTDFEAV